MAGEPALNLARAVPKLDRGNLLLAHCPSPVTSIGPGSHWGQSEALSPEAVHPLIRDHFYHNRCRHQDQFMVKAPCVTIDVLSESVLVG